jgi:hypothetical protein
LRTVAGDVANAIDLILACAACLLPKWLIHAKLATALLWQIAKWLSARLQMTDYLVGAGLALKVELGAVDKTLPWDA